jgi:type IV secretory pathway VirB10-like protein
VIAKRGRVAAIGVAGFVLACGFALVCCTRPTTPGVDATRPRADTGENGEVEPPARSERAAPEQPDEARAPAQATESAPPEIELETPEEPEPTTPRYLAIVEQVRPDQDATVRPTIVSPTKLELETDNVKRLRITREGLPLARNRSIVLRIDGQGIEWTPNYLAVELERSSAGIWEVVRRRPVEP